MEETLKSIVMALQDLKLSQQEITGRIEGVEKQMQKGTSPTLAAQDEDQLVSEIPVSEVKPKGSKRDRESLSKYADFQEKIRLEEEFEKHNEVSMLDCYGIRFPDPYTSSPSKFKLGKKDVRR